jgi:hypothetical protein
MKNQILSFILAAILSSCAQNRGSEHTNTGSDQIIRNQVLDVACNYAANSMTDANKTVSNDGSITFSSGDTKCLIDPASILIGEINEDSLKDAIVTIFTFDGQKLPRKDHLILVNQNGKLIVAKKLQGEMKFLSISDRIIYIETSKMAADSPFSDCLVCKEIKKYKFIAGDTLRIK